LPILITIFGGEGIVISVQAEELALLKNGRSLQIQNHQTVGGRIRLNIAGDDYIDIEPGLIDRFEPVAPVIPLSLSQATKPSSLVSVPVPPQPQQIRPAIQRVALKYNLDHKLITAMIRAESDFNPFAISPKGAQGLMQLMPETAHQFKVHNVFDIQENLDAGARYLKQLLKSYQNDLSLALAAYNAGPAAVSLYKGIPPFPETRQYIQKVLFGRLRVQ
jgi:soluble lytic murein transglycosylase-like protein